MTSVEKELGAPEGVGKLLNGVRYVVGELECNFGEWEIDCTVSVEYDITDASRDMLVVTDDVIGEYDASDNVTEDGIDVKGSFGRGPVSEKPAIRIK